MSARTVIYHPGQGARIETRMHGGHLYAAVIKDDHELAIFGDPMDVVALLTGLARSATDLAVLHASSEGHPSRLPAYTPTYPVDDSGVEITTGRFACCGAGTDMRDSRTGQRLHLAGCARIAAEGIAAARRQLHPDFIPTADDTRDELADAGAFDDMAVRS